MHILKDMKTQKTYEHRPASGLVTGILGTLLTLVLAVVVLSNAQAAVDWWRLRGYSPDTRIVALAKDTEMTDTGRHLFYVNKPQILSGNAFSGHCKTKAEKTIVLGCYESRDRGIYLYDVTDTRLQGVVETTAAHEMLHAAYDRLAADEKTKINALLKEYYAKGLHDDRLQRTIEAYKQSGANVQLSEMHSIFATEAAVLPEALETYYQRYFSDRATVVAKAQRYQAEFTSRRDKVALYDAQLAGLKQKITEDQSSSSALQRSLDSEYANLQSLQASGEYQRYNQLVGTYNAHVDSYNTLLGSIRADITQYNQIVERRNAIAIEEHDLIAALSDESATEKN